MEKVAANIFDEPPSKWAQLFEMLADLTDEDGAYAELDDLSDLFGLGLTTGARPKTHGH